MKPSTRYANQWGWQRPDADFAAYDRLVIEPVLINLLKDPPGHALGPAALRKIAENLRDGLVASIEPYYEVVTTGGMTDIVVPPGVLRAPVGTTSFQTLSNLDANAAVGDTYTTGVQIYDALGTSHVLAITYSNSGPGNWAYRVEVPGEDVTGGTAGTPFRLAEGTVSFDATGKLLAVDGGAPADVIITSPAWSNGAAASTISWDLVDANNQGALTGYDAASATASRADTPRWRGSNWCTVSNFRNAPVR